VEIGANPSGLRVVKEIRLPAWGDPFLDGSIVRCSAKRGRSNLHVAVDLTTFTVTKSTRPRLGDDERYNVDGWAVAWAYPGTTASSEVHFLDPEHRVVATVEHESGSTQTVCGTEDAWYVGFTDGWVRSFTLDGAPRWSWRIPGSEGTWGEWSYVTFRPRPDHMVVRGTLMVVAAHGKFWAIDAISGTELWHAQIPSEAEYESEFEAKEQARRYPLGPDIEERANAARLLGVDEHAGRAEIVRAWRTAVMASHPDLHPRDPTAAARFGAVQFAREVLLPEPAPLIRFVQSVTGVRMSVLPAAYAVQEITIDPSGAVVVSSNVGEYMVIEDWNTLSRIGLGVEVEPRRAADRVVYAERLSDSAVRLVTDTGGGVRAVWAGGWLREPSDPHVGTFRPLLDDGYDAGAVHNVDFDVWGNDLVLTRCGREWVRIYELRTGAITFEAATTTNVQKVLRAADQLVIISAGGDFACLAR
jgi:hypothetical protein